MRLSISFKASSGTTRIVAGVGACLVVISAFALFGPQSGDGQKQQDRIADIRKKALLRSQTWLNNTQIVVAGTSDSDEGELQSGLLEKVRMPDVPDILVSRPVMDDATLKMTFSIDYAPTGSVTVIKPKRLTGYRTGLERFHAKLSDIDHKRRKLPVTVLHIGGSHVAADGFSRGIREDMQARYGDAGRGMVQPAGIAGPGAADQMTMTISGSWKMRHAMKDRRGRFGIAGMSVSSSMPDASMRLTKNNGPFDWASVTIATGPRQGKVRLRVGKREKIYSARSRRHGSHTFRMDVGGTSLIVEPAGNGTTTVLNWATGKVRPGIRYVNFGLQEATADIVHRFNMKLMENDVRRLAPDLIIIGYGTKEGFDDGLGLSGYRERISRIVARLSRWAPDADFVFVGAASGLRKDGDSTCNGWSLPPKLAPLRKTVQQLATDHRGAYWDWSAAMGGPCAIDAWAKNGLAEKDRLHLTKTGYRRSARLFSDWLMQKTDDAVASN